MRVIQAPLVERERELKEFERLLGLPPALGKTHWPPLTNRVAA
ncbi:MAG TPA: hypothetical protein VGR74_06855 [Actinomycetota bacterium]|nr:hypothetical protein [Actinomycetota bacterium]